MRIPRVQHVVQLLAVSVLLLAACGKEGRNASQPLSAVEAQHIYLAPLGVKLPPESRDVYLFGSFERNERTYIRFTTNNVIVSSLEHNVNNSFEFVGNSEKSFYEKCNNIEWWICEDENVISGGSFVDEEVNGLRYAVRRKNNWESDVFMEFTIQ